MHRSLIIFCALAFTLVVIGCGPTREDAIGYNDAIVTEQERAVAALDQVFNSMKNYKDHAGMDTAFSNAEQTLASVTDNLKEMKDFDGNVGYRDTAVLLIEHYREILTKDMSEMIQLYKLPDTAYTMSKKDTFALIQDKVLGRLAKELRVLKTAQWNFAVKYDFEELLRNEGYVKSKD